MKSLKVAVMFVLAVCLISCTNGCASTNKNINAAKYNVNEKVLQPYLASVSVLDQDNFVSGSGTIVYNKEGKSLVVITAAHVVLAMEDRGKIIFVKTTFDNKIREMIVKKVDAGLDLAIIASVDKEKKDGPYAKIEKKGGKIGDNIFAIGCPKGEEFVVTNGIISKKFIRVDDYDMEGNEKITIRHLYRITAPIFYGNSGGGLFNENGKLVGVNVEISLAIGKIYLIEDGVAKQVNMLTLFPQPGTAFAVSEKDIFDFIK